MRFVLICGDRHWSNRELIRQELKLLPKGTVILEGGCSGADRIAAEEALSLGFTVREFPALWDEYGITAGLIRNQEMIDQHPCLVIAFHNDILGSRGTADTIRRAKKAGIPYKVIAEYTLNL